LSAAEFDRADDPVGRPRRPRQGDAPCESGNWKSLGRSSATGVVIVRLQGYRQTSTAESEMSRGTVKWFNSQKGYGFIQPQSGGKDVFVHISAVERAGLSGLNEGQVVEYQEVANKGKTSAENLKVQR
jgi:CspA family cold shock protein